MGKREENKIGLKKMPSTKRKWVQKVKKNNYKDGGGHSENGN